MTKPNVSFFKRWINRFTYALRGLRVALTQEESFRIHLPAAVVVIALAAWLQVSLVEWLVLILCITMVIAAELFNTAIEHLAREIGAEQNESIRNALDISAAAVLIVAWGAKVVGLVVFGWRLFV